MTEGDITTALEGVDKCNKHIRKIEQLIEVVQGQDDIATVARLEYTLMKWTERLSYFIKQAAELGETKTDVTKLGKTKKEKIRFNAD